jgi:FG-GAP-like repeat
VAINTVYGNIATFLADVTGDGKADLIAINSTGTTVRRSTGTIFGPSEFWGNPFYNTDTGTGRENFFADVSGDGKADAIVVNNDGISVRVSTGTSFGATQFWGSTFYGARGTFLANVNGEVGDEIIVVNDSSTTVRRPQ